jgi:hypothetical protein
MAARIRKGHQEDVRTRIKASQLINLLTNHALDPKNTVDQSRIKAAEILLKKILPDLSAVEMSQVEELPQEIDLVTGIIKSISKWEDSRLIDLIAPLLKGRADSTLEALILPLLQGRNGLKHQLAQVLNAELAQSEPAIQAVA